MEIKNKHFFNLLKSIEEGGDINHLIDNGLEYFQIAEYISFFIKEGFIDDSYKLTKKGQEKFKELLKENKEDLLPPLNVKVEKIKNNEVYVPPNKNK